MTDRFDSPETLFWLMSAVAALIAVLIAYGYIGTDVTPGPAPPPPAHYQHPEGTMSGFHYPEFRGRVLSDSDSNILWSLRFEPCTGDEDCDPEYPYHTEDCPMKEER